MSWPVIEFHFCYAPRRAQEVLNNTRSLIFVCVWSNVTMCMAVYYKRRLRLVRCCTTRRQTISYSSFYAFKILLSLRRWSASSYTSNLRTIFRWWYVSSVPIPSSHTMAVGLTHSLTEMSTRKCLALPARKADNLTVHCEPIAWNIWDPRHITALLASTAYYRDSFTLL
jgi:hypothetical protein